MNDLGSYKQKMLIVDNLKLDKMKVQNYQ